MSWQCWVSVGMTASAREAGVNLDFSLACRAEGGVPTSALSLCVGSGHVKKRFHSSTQVAHLSLSLRSRTKVPAIDSNRLVFNNSLLRLRGPGCVGPGIIRASLPVFCLQAKRNLPM
eukprot:364198-Chlamydomonas_euryale.AAC.19